MVPDSTSWPERMMGLVPEVELRELGVFGLELEEAELLKYETGKIGG